MSDVAVSLQFSAEGLSELLSEIKQLNSNLDTTSKSGDTASKGVDKVDKSAKTTTKSTNSLSSAMKSLASNPLVMAVGAVAAFVGATAKATNAINEQIKSERNLSLAVVSNSKLNSESAKSLAAFASELQGSTTYGDEFTMSLMQMGAQAGATEDEIKSMTTLALDIASQSGQDASTVMKSLTLSYQDVDKATKLLTQSGLALTAEEQAKVDALKASGKEAEANQVIFDKLNNTFGGAASKEAESTAGLFQQIQNILGDVLEEYGRIVNAFAKPIASGLKDISQQIYDVFMNPDFISAIQNIITGVNVLSSIIMDVLGFALQFVIDVVMATVERFNSFIEVFASVGESAEGFSEIIDVAIGGVINTFKALFTTVEAVANAITAFLANPFDVGNIIKQFDGVGEAFTNIFDPEANKQALNEVKEFVAEVKADVVSNWEFGGGAIKAEAPEIIKELQQIEEENEDTVEEIKNDWAKASESMLSAMSSAFKGFSALFAQNETDLTSYDEQIQAIEDKWSEFYAMREENEALIAEEEALKEIMNEDQLAFLAEQYDSQDALGKNAIANMQKELETKKATELAELEATKKAAAEEEALELAKNKEIAQAEYARSYAEWQSNVKLAEQTHAQTIADAVIGTTQATLQAVIGLATSFATLGPIVGPIVGAAVMAGIIGSAAGAAAGVKSSASELDAVKGSQPTPPSFRFGTGGYELEDGASAIVGEAGAEVVSNNAGSLEVQSAYATSQQGTGGGDNITVNISASEYSKSELQDMITEILSGSGLKDRNIAFNV